MQPKRYSYFYPSGYIIIVVLTIVIVVLTILIGFACLFVFLFTFLCYSHMFEIKHSFIHLTYCDYLTKMCDTGLDWSTSHKIWTFDLCHFQYFEHHKLIAFTSIMFVAEMLEIDV